MAGFSRCAKISPHAKNQPSRSKIGNFGIMCFQMGYHPPFTPHFTPFQVEICKTDFVSETSTLCHFQNTPVFHSSSKTAKFTSGITLLWRAEEITTMSFYRKGRMVRILVFIFFQPLLGLVSSPHSLFIVHST